MAEIIVSAKNVELAVEKGAAELGKTAEEVKYEVIEEGKKGLFGIGAVDAKVRVYVEDEEEAEEAEAAADTEETEEYSFSEDEIGLPEKAALDILTTIIEDMGINASAKIVNIEYEDVEGKSVPEKNVYVEIVGDDLGTLIGRHGDVLDALQYLANIAAGRKVKVGEERTEYVKICLDIENYRAKREETLRALARRTADKAVRYHRNMTLEPMLAYERKVIHAELQNYEGVFTYSVGSDSDRRVVVALGTPENPIRPQVSHSRVKPYDPERFGKSDYNE